jgi:hypothetical protein
MASEILIETIAQKRQLLAFGLGHGLGSAPEQRDYVLMSCRELNQIESVEPGNLLASVGAGLTLEDLDKALAPTGLYWPVTGPTERTLGGIMNDGLLGAQTMAKGTINDWILGASFLTAKGDIVSSGGRTLKNVSGYDFTRLAWRSHGSLAISLSFIVKLLPRPAVAPVMRYRVDSPKLAANLLPKVLLNKIGAWGLRLVNDDDGLRIVVWLGGFGELVKHQQKQLASIFGESSDTFEDGFGYFNEHNRRWPTGVSSLTRYIGSRAQLLNLAGRLANPADYSYDLDLGAGRFAASHVDEKLQTTVLNSGLSPLNLQGRKLEGHIFRRLKKFLDPDHTFKSIS